MKRTLLALALLAASTQAQATTTHRLDATTLLPSLVSDFWIDFMDTDNNGILSNIPEITDFSGVIYIGVTYTEVSSIAEIANVSSGPSDTWTFLQSGSTLKANSVHFSHKITPVSQVPVPASLLSMVGGIGLLGWAGRRRAKAAKRA